MNEVDKESTMTAKVASQINYRKPNELEKFSQVTKLQL